MLKHNNTQGGYGRNSKGNRNKGKVVGNMDLDNVKSPYNFIPFVNKSLKFDEVQMSIRNAMSEELISGKIEYEILARTPIFIDNGKESFYCNEYGKYAIPGTSIRGCIRANALALSAGDYSGDIEDYRLMYRNIANGAEKDTYNKILGNKTVKINDRNVSILENVRAGYIRNEGGKYYIYDTKKTSIDHGFNGLNYYVLSERFISEHLDDKNFFFFKKNKNSFQNILGREFKVYKKNGKKHYKGTENEYYKPFYWKISYLVNERNRNITAVGEPGDYENKGYLLGSGYMNEKKALYIIPEKDDNNIIIELPKKTIKDYEHDLNFRKKLLKNEKYYELPDLGNEKPIFYIHFDGRWYFGFTPRLRLFYNHSVKEGYRKKEQKFDYVKSIFGCINDEEGYKSKVSFSDALLVNEKKPMGVTAVILGEPKPTSYLDYLKQEIGQLPNTYNTENFELRGAKRYWLHENVIAPESHNENDNVKSNINPLPKDSLFKGVVRFQNLTELELGLLLWSIKLEDNSEINIGKAKAYGYGRCKVQNIKVDFLNLSKAYDLNTYELYPFDKENDFEKYIEEYKCKVKEEFGIDVYELESVKALLLMTDSTRIPTSGRTGYMKLNCDDRNARDTYRRRIKELIPLPTSEYIVKNK